MPVTLARVALELGCLWIALHARVPQTALRRFFWANLAMVLILEPLNLSRVPQASPLYYVSFIVCIAVLHFTMAAIMIEATKIIPIDRRLLVWFTGGLFAGVFAYFLRGHGLYGWINEVDGSLQLLWAIPTGLAAITLCREGMEEERNIAVKLFLMWMAQSLFSLGLTMHLWDKAWMEYLEWMPAIITSTGCLWLTVFWHRQAALLPHA